MTFYICDSSLEDLLNKQERNVNLSIEWADCNYMKLNEDMYHLIISGHKSQTIWAKVG